MEANARRNAWSEEFPSTSAHVTIPLSSYSVSLHRYHEALGECKVLWKTCASTLLKFIKLVSFDFRFLWISRSLWWAVPRRFLITQRDSSHFCCVLQVDPFVISLYLASRLLGIARTVFYMTTFIVGWDRSVCFDQALGYTGGAQGCLLWRNVMEALSWVLKRHFVEMESFCLT